MSFSSMHVSGFNVRGALGSMLTEIQAIYFIFLYYLKIVFVWSGSEDITRFYAQLNWACEGSCSKTV